MIGRFRIFTLFALLLSLSSCEGEEAEAITPPPPPVRIEEARLREVTPTSRAVGEIEALRAAQIRAEAAGRVVAVEVDAGDAVEGGDLLVKLDVGRSQIAAEAASANLEQARARLSQALREREMAEELVESGGLAPRGLEDAQDAERLARAAVDAAGAQLRVTRRGITEAVVRAPFSGTVIERIVEVGEYVGPGTPLLQLVDGSELRARVLLDPRDALDTEVGAPVEIEAHARPGERFTGSVIAVGDVVDRRTRRLPLRIEVDDPDQRLRPGLVARFAVQVGEPRRTITVSPQAVFERFGQSHVYVVEEGVAVRRTIRIGEERAEYTEVLDGLRAGDPVVVDGLDRVVAERPVRVVTPMAGGGRESEAGRAP